MNKPLLVALAVCAVSLTCRPTLAQDPPERDRDPAAIARRCMNHISNVSERCIEQNEKVADRCVAEIGELLAEGETRRAHRLAAHCKAAIHRQSEDCLRHIQHDCRHCAELLSFLGAEDLADEVEAHCEAAAHRVNQSRRAAIDAIDAALETAPSV